MDFKLAIKDHERHFTRKRCEHVDVANRKCRQNGDDAVKLRKVELNNLHVDKEKPYSKPMYNMMGRTPGLA